MRKLLITGFIIIAFSCLSYANYGASGGGGGDITSGGDATLGNISCSSITASNDVTCEALLKATTIWHDNTPLNIYQATAGQPIYLKVVSNGYISHMVGTSTYMAIVGAIGDIDVHKDMDFNNEGHILRVGSVTASNQVSSNGYKLHDDGNYSVTISSPYQLINEWHPIGKVHNYATTLSSVTGVVYGASATNCQFALEQRNINSLNSDGTPILTSSPTATTVITGGAFNDYTLPALTDICIKVISVTGDVTGMKIFITQYRN